MSVYSWEIRQRFLAQLSLATVGMHRCAIDLHPHIRFVEDEDVPSFEYCPLTVVCHHVYGTHYFQNVFYHAAEDLAIPRGMAQAIALAADRTEWKSPWREKVLAWWRHQMLDATETR